MSDPFHRYACLKVSPPRCTVEGTIMDDAIHVQVQVIESEELVCRVQGADSGMLLSAMS